MKKSINIALISVGLTLSLSGCDALKGESEFFTLVKNTCLASGKVYENTCKCISTYIENTLTKDEQTLMVSTLSHMNKVNGQKEAEAAFVKTAGELHMSIADARLVSVKFGQQAKAAEQSCK